MNLEELTQLELKYNFTYPALYKRLCLDGMLSYGKQDSKWREEVYPMLCEFPPLLLFGFDFELMFAQEIDAEITYYRTEDCFKKEYHLIPFAKNEAGDKYCFFTDRVDESGEMPIVFAPHDDIEAVIYARNLRDAIFRNMVEVASAWNIDDKQLKGMQNMLLTHLRYLSVEQQKCLADLYRRPLRIYEWTSPNGQHQEEYTVLIKREAAEVLLKELIGFEDYDVRFSYMVE